MAATGWSLAGRSRATRPGMSSARAICGRRSNRLGKNVDACLKAGGATVNNIVFTVSHVTAPAEFDKYADLLPRYFGPPSPQSTTVAMPQLSDPDLLLEVEAIAAIK